MFLYDKRNDFSLYGFKEDFALMSDSLSTCLNKNFLRRSKSTKKRSKILDVLFLSD